MRILIGYDGSASADAAISDLTRAGLPREAEVLVVSVADVLMVPSPSDYEVVGQALTSRRVTSGLIQAQAQAARVLKEAEEFAAKATDRVRWHFPDWQVSAETPAGTASRELIKRADEWKADLIVVGSHGRSALGRLLLGSVSKKVVTDSHHSVRVVRGAVEKSDDLLPPRVMIGADGSREAESAVRVVGGRVWPEGTEVRIIAVDDGISPAKFAHIPPLGTAKSRDNSEESAVAARMMVEWAENELRAINLDVSVAIEKGDPQKVLIEEARQWEADSIFVGGRIFSGAIERYRLGSVATALATRAPCSVEVVREAMS